MAKKQNRNHPTDAVDALFQLSSGVLSAGVKLATKAVSLPFQVADDMLDTLAQPSRSEATAGKDWTQAQLDKLRYNMPLFSTTSDPETSKNLDAGILSTTLKTAFETNGHPLSGNAEILYEAEGISDIQCMIKDQNACYVIKKQNRELAAYTRKDSDISGCIPATDREALNREEIPTSIRNIFFLWGDGLSNAAQIYADPNGSSEYMYLWAFEDGKKSGGIEAERDQKSQPVIKPNTRKLTIKDGETERAFFYITLPSDSTAWEDALKEGFKIAGIDLSDQAVLAPESDTETNIWNITDKDQKYTAEIGAQIDGISLTVKRREERRLFSISDAFQKDVSRGLLSEGLRNIFQKNGHALSDEAEIPRRLAQIQGIDWMIADGDKTYWVASRGKTLKIYASSTSVDPLAESVIVRYFSEIGFDSFIAFASEFDPYSVDKIKDYWVFIQLFNTRRGALDWLRGQSHTIEPIDSRKLLTFIRDFFIQTAPLPEWADRRLLEQAEEAFDLYKIPYMTVLLFRALPETYACWRGAQVLTVTGRLTLNPSDKKADQMSLLSRRVAATGQFVLDVMSDDAFAPNGKGTRTTQVLRLLHEGIRFIIAKEQAEWPFDRLGEPINQEDLLMTMLAFSVIVFDGMKMLNVRLSPEEEEALFHRWKVMGYYLGIREDLLEKLETADDGRALWDAIVAKQQQYDKNAPNRKEAQAGIDLTDALIAFGQTITSVNMPRAIPEYLVRYLVDDELANRLGVAPAQGIEPQLLTLWGRANWSVIQIWKDQSIFARKIFQMLNDELFDRLFDTWVVDRPVIFYRESDDDQDAHA